MPTPLLVLQIEDCESDADIAIRFLEKGGYEVQRERVEDAPQMRAALQSQTWDVVICDYRLPQFDAPAALDVLKQSKLDIPFIVVSGTIGEEIAVEMMRNGAHDYLMKDSLARLAPSVAREVAEARHRAEGRRTQEALLLTRFTIEHSAEAIFWIKPDGSFFDVNETACRSLGYTREELLTMRVQMIDSDYSGLKWPQQWEELRQQGARIIETKHRAKDGHEVDVEINVNYFCYQGQEYHCALARDITQRKRIEEAMKASLEEKTVLLKEVHHRVKNNLQIVCSLMSLQSSKVKSPEALAALRETGNRVRTMALLHETLYQSGNLARVNFEGYIKSIGAFLLGSYGTDATRIKLDYQLDEVSLDLDAAVPCGLIYNELVSNALKHAFRDGRQGQITVGLQALPNGIIVLRVADNGIGMASKPDADHSESLGHRLVYMLAAQLQGKVECQREAGTAFTITFQPKR